MIAGFGDKETEALFNHQRVRRIDSRIQRAALRKLLVLDAAANLDDLKSPPGNRLEALKGKREGEHSIRINDQWRIVFLWKAGNAYQVSVTDYH